MLSVHVVVRIVWKRVITALTAVQRWKARKMKMTNAEEAHIAEMNRLREAIKKTDSEYLKADYSKALKRMKRELKEYRRFRSGE